MYKKTYLLRKKFNRSLCHNLYQLNFESYEFEKSDRTMGK